MAASHCIEATRPRASGAPCLAALARRWSPLRTREGWPAFALVVASLSPTSVTAIESQALGSVAALPPRIHQVFSCGTWSRPSASGFFRIVLVDVSFGTGSEVYVQRIQEAVDSSGQSLTLLETVPVHQLNDDHAQYRVSSAKCGGAKGRRRVEIIATFEHDEGDLEHRIRVSLASRSLYEVTSSVRRPLSKN